MFRKNLKKHVGKVALGIMLAAMGLSFSSPMKTEAAASNAVVIYKDANRQTDPYTISTNSRYDMGLGNHSKKLSSIDIGSDRSVILYDEAGNGLLLGPGVYNDLGHWNDRAVRICVNPMSFPEESIGEYNARIYPNHMLSSNNGKNFYTVGLGEISQDALRNTYTAVGVNNLSSLSVGAKSRVIMKCSDGKTVEAWRGSHYRMGDFDNKVVSMVTLPFNTSTCDIIDMTVGTNFDTEKVTFFSESNAVGDRLVLGAGEYGPNELGAVGTKNISSIHVPYGYIVTVYKVKATPSTTGERLISKTFLDGTHNDLGIIDNETTHIKILKPAAMEYTLQKARIQHVQEWEVWRTGTLNGAPVMGYPKSTISTSYEIFDEKATARTESRTESETVFAGSSVLTNRTDEEQNMTSQQFEFTEENSVTTSITHGFGTAIEGSAEFGIGDSTLGISVTASYDYSNTNENSQTRSVTYVVPSQYITVPAGKSVKVVARLEKIQATGTVNLEAQAKVKDSGYLEAFSHGPTGWSCLGTAPYNLDYTAPVKGIGEYKAEYAANLFIDVIDVSTNQSLDSAQSQVMVIEDRAGNSARVIADEHHFDLTSQN